MAALAALRPAASGPNARLAPLHADAAGFTRPVGCNSARKTRHTPAQLFVRLHLTSAGQSVVECQASPICGYRPMLIPFDPLKVAQAAAVLLKTEPNRCMSRLRLL